MWLWLLWKIHIWRNVALLLAIITHILLHIGISILHWIRIDNSLDWHYHWCLRWIHQLLFLLLNDELLFFEVSHNLTVNNSSKDISISQIPCKIINIIAEAIPNFILVLICSTDRKQNPVAEDSLWDSVRVHYFLRLLLFFLIEEVALPRLFKDQPHIFSDLLHEFAQVKLLVLTVVKGSRKD